jgi:hypothetical protein
MFIAELEIGPACSTGDVANSSQGLGSIKYQRVQPWMAQRFSSLRQPAEPRVELARHLALRNFECIPVSFCCICWLLVVRPSQ